MSFPEEDDWLGGYGLDDYNKCTSPLGADTSLSLAGVSVREPSPVSPSRDLGGIPFGDNSLSVPMRDFSFGNEPPRLSPESSYQSMAPLQSTSYDPTAVHTQIDASYNSFEQPSIIVNGHYARPLDQPIPQQQFFQQQPDPPPPPLATMSLHHHQSQASGSVMQQMLSTPPVRQTSTPQQQQPPSRQRLIQPKTQNNGRKRTSGAANNNSVGAVLTKANRIAASTSSDVQSQGGSRNTTEVRICGEDSVRVSQITSEITQLQDQQAKFGIDNKGRIVELESERANIFLKALTSQHVGETVLNQVAQVAAAARQSPQPRSNVNRSRSHHARTSSQFDVAPDSPQYQPQMYLSQYPTTSTAQFHDYSSNHTQPQVIHQQTQPSHPQQNQRQVFRTGSVVYQNSSQVPQGAVYVQSVPPPAQAQYSQPTVGQVVRQQHQLRHVSGGQQVMVQQHVLIPPGSNRTHLVQQQQLVPSQVIIPTSQSQAQVLVVQHVSSAQCKKRLEEKRGLRQLRIREYFNKLHSSLNHPDTEIPFTNLNDVLQRLLPYHSYGEPSLKEEQLEQFDINYLRTTINLGEQRKRLEKRIRKVFYDEALKNNEDEEKNLLLYLDCEYERQKLEEEKAYINADTLATFVQNSSIISALRSSDSLIVDRLKSDHLSKCVKTITQQYEYHPFSEIPRPTSPFKTPSPWKSPASSIRSPSPIKSPCSVHSPRLRGRSSASYTQLTPAKEPVRIRQTSKPRSVTDTKPVIDKNEVAKLELLKSTSVQAVKNSTSHSRIGLVKNEETSTTPLPFSCSSAASTSKTVHSLSSPKYSSVTFGRLPAKKELLSRARKGVPPALRSPPAQSTLIPSLSLIPQSAEQYEGSDGSASPELGLDDADNLCPPVIVSPVTPLPPASNSSKASLVEMFQNSDGDELVRRLSPKTLDDAKCRIERFNVINEDQPVERIRFKPQVPRPTPMSPVEVSFSLHEINVKGINQEATNSANNHIIENSSVEKNCAPVRPPPIKLKLKLGGDSKQLYIDNNENSLRESFRKKHKKHKKKKRKREREQNRRHSRDNEHRDIVLVPTEGPRIKIKIGLNNSLGHTTTTVPCSKADILKYSTVPSAINSTEYKQKDEIHPPPMKVPRLKIRLGTDPAALPISVMQQNGPTKKTRQLSQIPVDPVGIEFSDDSDSEAERLRSATDKALRGLPSFVGISSLPKPTNTPLLPWSTRPAP